MKHLFLVFLLLTLLSACHRTGVRRASTDVDHKSVSTTLYFNFDRAQIRPQDEEIISVSAERMKKNRELIVVLEGYTDNIGDKEYNLRLGDQRARAVKAALIRKGIDPSRLVVVSFGEEKPAVSTPVSKNRRVQIKSK